MLTFQKKDSGWLALQHKTIIEAESNKVQSKLSPLKFKSNPPHPVSSSPSPSRPKQPWPFETPTRNTLNSSFTPCPSQIQMHVHANILSVAPGSPNGRPTPELVS